MARRPNILLLCSDHQQGRTVDPDCPCRTPTADRLAEEGIRFSFAYTPVDLTGPAHASLLTGLYPTQHGMLNNWWSGPVLRTDINPGLVTYPQRLREAGYELSSVGGFPATPRDPREFGFETVLLRGPGRPYRKPETWPPPPPKVKGEFKEACIIERPGWGERLLFATIPGDRRPEAEKTEAAVSEIHRLAKVGKPWFLRVKFTAPHDPYVVSERHLGLYRLDEVLLPENFHDDLSDKPAIYRRWREELWGKLTEEDYRKALMHYWALTTCVDEEFGRILDALDEVGQAENTLVIYTSDHGDMAASHGLFLKGVTPFEEVYRVPLIVRWPDGVRNPGRECDAFVTWLDLAATIVDVAGAEPLPNSPGRSLLPFLRNEEPPDWPREFFGQFTGTEYYYTQRILRTREFKLVFNGFDFDELYDLRRDPFEMRNLARDPAYEEVKRKLYRKLWDRMIEVDDPLVAVHYPTVSLATYGPFVEG